MEKIIRIDNLGITIEFINSTQEVKDKIMYNILTRAFKNTSATSSLQKKKILTQSLLQKSINQLEKEENFEECQILLQLKNYVDNYKPKPNKTTNKQ